MRTVKNKRAYAAWHHFYDSPYNDLAIEWFAKAMHPDLFSELVDQVLAPVGVEHELTYHRGGPPVLNDDVSTALLSGKMATSTR